MVATTTSHDESAAGFGACSQLGIGGRRVVEQLAAISSAADVNARACSVGHVWTSLRGASAGTAAATTAAATTEYHVLG